MIASGYTPESDSPFDTAMRYWLAMARDPRELTAFSPEALDEFRSCCQSLLGRPCYERDFDLRDFARSGGHGSGWRHEPPDSTRNYAEKAEAWDRLMASQERDERVALALRDFGNNNLPMRAYFHVRADRSGNRALSVARRALLDLARSSSDAPRGRDDSCTPAAATAAQLLLRFATSNARLVVEVPPVRLQLPALRLAGAARGARSPYRRRRRAAG